MAWTEEKKYMTENYVTASSTAWTTGASMKSMGVGVGELRLNGPIKSKNLVVTVKL